MADTHKDTQGCGCGCGAKAQHHMPAVTFSTFILSLGSSALVHLGEVPDPETGQTASNLLMAKHTIDVLTMLQEKTRNCLDADERKLLDGLLYELRMKYVVQAR